MEQPRASLVRALRPWWGCRPPLQQHRSLLPALTRVPRRLPAETHLSLPSGPTARPLRSTPSSGAQRPGADFCDLPRVGMTLSSVRRRSCARVGNASHSGWHHGAVSGTEPRPLGRTVDPEHRRGCRGSCAPGRDGATGPAVPRGRTSGDFSPEVGSCGVHSCLLA